MCYIGKTYDLRVVSNCVHGYVFLWLSYLKPTWRLEKRDEKATIELVGKCRTAMYIAW